MPTEMNKVKIITSLIWKFMELGGTQGMQLIVQIVLARLLAPEQFGTIALVTVFISIARVFIQSGFNTALIQKRDPDEVDFSSVFYISLSLAGILYMIIYFTAPLISIFYRDPILTSVLRVLSLTLFFGAFNSIQNAYIAKKMMFKKLFISSLGAILISGIIGIIAAFNELGIWALVIQQLVNQISITIILLAIVSWRPKLVFSIKRVKLLFSFGWKLLASTLLETIYREIRTLIIGRAYSSAMLGLYNRGEQFPKVIVANINGSIQSVMLPTLSACQDDKEKVKRMVRRSIVSSSFLIFPMMVGMAAVAEPLVKIVLTDKWLPAVPFLQIFSISYALMPIHTANLQSLNAMGRSDIFLKLEIIKKVIGIFILFISMHFGIYAIAFGMLISGLISSFINAYPNKKLLNYGYFEQIRDIMPSLSISIVMGIAVYTLNSLDIIAWKMLIFQVITGVIVYVSLATAFRNESLNYFITTIKELLLRK